MQFTMKITPDGGEPEEYIADTRDIYMWERTNKEAKLGNLMEAFEIDAMYKIAWFAAKRHGLIEGMKIDEFVATYALDFEEVESGAADPTRPGQ